MIDDLAPLSFVERLTRVEERLGGVVLLLDEIRSDQKDLGEVVARASGGLRAVLMLGGLAGVAGGLKALAGWLASAATSLSGSR